MNSVKKQATLWTFQCFERDFISGLQRDLLVFDVPLMTVEVEEQLPLPVFDDGIDPSIEHRSRLGVDDLLPVREFQVVTTGCEEDGVDVVTEVEFRSSRFRRFAFEFETQPQYKLIRKLVETNDGAKS